MEQAAVDKALADVKDQAATLSDVEDADVIFFNGDVQYGTAYDFIVDARPRQKRKNAIIIPITGGGDTDAAYRIARYLQRAYEGGSILAFVPSLCKSAGTLLVAGAHKLYMGELGELGPLDIQLSKKDELWEYGSGLNVDAAIAALQKTSDKMFFDYLHRIKRRNSNVTYRTAAAISADLTSKLLGPVYAQVDPAEIGENSRSMEITKNYARRLDVKTKNFISSKTLDYLVESYPDHGFVIDRTEAADIFKSVEPPTSEMSALEQALGLLAHDLLDWEAGVEYVIRYLVAEPMAEVLPKLSVMEGGIHE